MINLDTNILVRIVKTDPDFPKQSEYARKIVRKAWESETAIFITSITIVEFCWVMLKSYKIKREEVADFIDYLLALDLAEFEHRIEVMKALSDFRGGKGDFADYLIARIGEAHGCEITWTFDQALSDKSLFEIKRGT